MANNGGWDPHQDDWGSEDDWGTGEAKSDFQFDWNPEDNFSLPQGNKRSPLTWIAQQALWTKLLAGGGALLLVVFVFIQAGGVSRLQMMGLFRESVSPTAGCLNSGQVMMDLGMGLVNNAAMRRAIDRANKLRSQRTGDAQVDEAMWSVADAVYKTSDAAKSLSASFSFADLMAGDLTDRLQSPEIVAAAESLTRATELWSSACEELPGEPGLDATPQQVETQPEDTPSDVASSPAPATAVGVDMFSPPPNLEGVIERTQAATVEVVCIPNASATEYDAGSGFVGDISSLVGSVSSEVVIVTNHHVIERCVDGGEILIAQDENAFPAELLGSDAMNDLALLRSSALGRGVLSPSTQIQVGQWVMASGFPQDVGQTVTFGQVTGRDPLDDWITSNALVGPGNSGGPLVNSRGEVIGVVVARFIQIEGFSSSVPIERVCDNLVECR